MRKLSLFALLAGVPLQSNAAEPPKCEVNLKADYLAMLPLAPPRTEYNPSGSVVIEFTVNPDGMVSDVSFVDWSILPSDDFMRDYLRESAKTWRFPRRDAACRAQQKITIKLDEDA